MSPIRTLAAGVAAAALVILATAVPASAHDELISSDPAADARLDAPPKEVTMVFSGELLVLDDSDAGARAVVVDQSGKDWIDGDIVVNGETVTVPLADGMPEAGYQVRWQVVSEDGHPIAGVIPFTIGDAKPMTTDSPASASPSPAVVDAQDEGAAAGPPRALLIGVGGAVIAAAAYVLYLVIRRRKKAAASIGAAEEL
ncbi:copper resistance protein CopC [Microbacterium bovistercoris]|uniref:Copper resistance protein CopC n=1 Tax=Microbacterium bovistercoris TaxID=2293570 RepID=A0A371NNU2_9MICO|nr:copper resistance CopC family protein [Microbacterium bovistercoris]REJ03852.1 copper resistance protein CopC [Microbacterium bovistercoris]